MRLVPSSGLATCCLFQSVFGGCEPAPAASSARGSRFVEAERFSRIFGPLNGKLTCFLCQRLSRLCAESRDTDEKRLFARGASVGVTGWRAHGRTRPRQAGSACGKTGQDSPHEHSRTTPSRHRFVLPAP